MIRSITKLVLVLCSIIISLSVIPGITHGFDRKFGGRVGVDGVGVPGTNDNQKDNILHTVRTATNRVLGMLSFAALMLCLYADLSHIGGFIAAKELKNPFDYGFHAMMTTTHKSLRGPRGALILSKGIVSNPLKKPEDTIDNLPTRIDRAVFPGMQGGPHMNTIAGIAVALGEAQTQEFRNYAHQTLVNAKVLAEEMLGYGYKLVTGGTDNHMIVMDFSGESFNGADIEKVLDKVGISTSKSTIPDDPNPPFKPSGLRIGMQAMTTRGVKEDDTKHIAKFIHEAIENRGDENRLEIIHKQVVEFCEHFPIPSI